MTKNTYILFLTHALGRRRQWHPTPVLLPGKSQGQGSLVGCRLWGRTESDTTEATQQQQHRASSVRGGLLVGSGEEVRPHVVKNEQSDRTGSPVGCHPWGRTELDTTEATQQQQQHLIHSEAT